MGQAQLHKFISLLTRLAISATEEAVGTAIDHTSSMHLPVIQPSQTTYLKDKTPPLAFFSPDKYSIFELVFAGSTHLADIVLKPFAAHRHAATDSLT